MDDSRYIKAADRDEQFSQRADDAGRLYKSHAVADDMLAEALNYIEQAQIIVANSDRKGASILYSMGCRLIDRYKQVMG